MKAILTYEEITNGEKKEKTSLFDTEKAKKICDTINAFGHKIQEIYITEKGTLFLNNINDKKLAVANQEECKKWIGEHEADKYIECFGEVEEG